MEGKDERVKKELQESYKEIGRLFGKSLGDGITESASQAKNAADALGDALLESQKAYLEEIERVEQATEDAREEKYRREYANRLSKARTYQQAEIVRQNEMFRLQKKANDEYLEELEKHLKLVEEQIKAQKEKITSEFDQIAKRASDSLSELENARREMAEKMQDYGGIFESKSVIFRNAGPNETPIYYEDTILDLSDEREELEKYAELLESVKNLEDVPQEMFSAIRKLSVSDAIRFQEELLKMSGTERTTYFEDWQAIQQLSEQTSNLAYEEETRQVLDGIEQELTTWYGTIPEGFFVEGELSAEFFGEGFMSKMESMKTEIENAVLSVMQVDLHGVDIGETEANHGEKKQFLNSVTYVLNSAGETVAEQLRSARSHAEITRLRGDF